jgi:hypothetical protein
MNDNETVTAEKKQNGKNFMTHEEEKTRNEIISNLKDLVSCLNFCDHEIHRLEKKISIKIQQLDNSWSG